MHGNTRQPPFDGIRVRQALAYAMDPGRIARYRGAEFTRVAKSVIPSSNLGQIEDFGQITFDAEKAKAMVAAPASPADAIKPTGATGNRGPLAPSMSCCRVAQHWEAPIAPTGKAPFWQRVSTG